MGPRRDRRVHHHRNRLGGREGGRPAGVHAHNGDTALVALQNSSDPITYWQPDLLWKPPEWLDGPRGPDVSDDMFWMPVVTFWQTAADMAFSTGVPPGHGHKYGANPVDAWAAIYPPDAWTEAKNQELRDIIGHD